MSDYAKNVQMDLEGISDRIRLIQKCKGLTDAQMAEKLHFSLGTYRGYKCGRPITIANAMQFAYVFGLSLDFLLRGDDTYGVFVEENASLENSSKERMAVYLNLLEADYSDCTDEEKKTIITDTLELLTKIIRE
ncbi:MAG: helix-turn-helix transcriptional regulator [Lachnospiraceae bacterium]|nr:helix-turn-helix transcriptional regulator [Lachnospiraceae bacterium]